ncbi:hypothetical protein GCM10017668_69350 [Streptomyces tuirus]|uniref:Uncharacterized protein n=1 Tax=Streptomyces tuirus TaxID=68278 RepID=A0A7G1NRF9_9ACTN|nr:hypothetical protein GCM10017668_69350 [Streptomyces tuirus]
MRRPGIQGSGGHPRIVPALGKIRLKTDPSAANPERQGEKVRRKVKGLAKRITGSSPAAEATTVSGR